MTKVEQAIKARVEAKAKNAMPAIKAEDKENVIGKFFKALAEKDTATLKALSDGQNVTNNGDGGYLVPTELSSQIMKQLDEVSPIRQMVTVIGNLPPILELPIEDTLPTAYWVGEGEAPTKTKSTFKKVKLVPYKLGAYVKFTHESLVDTATNPSLQAFVTSRVTDAISLKENDAFVNGDGEEKPLGFRNASFEVNTGAVATAGVLTYKDLVKAMFGVHPAVRANAVFAMPTHALEQVVAMTDDNGRPIYVPAMDKNAPATILGHAVYEVPEIPETDTTEIWFGDFKKYLAGDREGLRVQLGTTGNDLESDIVSLVVFKRTAGVPTYPEAFYKLTGVPTGLPAGSSSTGE